MDCTEAIGSAEEAEKEAAEEGDDKALGAARVKRIKLLLRRAEVRLGLGV